MSKMKDSEIRASMQKSGNLIANSIPSFGRRTSSAEESKQQAIAARRAEVTKQAKKITHSIK